MRTTKMAQRKQLNHRNLFDTFTNEPVKRQANDEEEGHLVKKMRKPLVDVRSKQNPSLQSVHDNLNVRVLRNKAIVVKQPITRTKANNTKEQKLQRLWPLSVADLPLKEAILRRYSCFKDDRPKKYSVRIKPPEKMKLLLKESNSRNQFDGQDLAADIVEYLLNLEIRHQISREYFLKEMSPITSHKRAVLVNWLIEIQDCLGLTQETLYLTIMVVDRILFSNELSVNVFQLLGITALFIITKLEDRFPPEIKTLIHMTDNAYKHSHLILMERFVLRNLKFDLIMAEPMCFLNRFIQNIKKSSTVKYLSMYFLDTFLLNKESAVLLPSRLSAAAFSLACYVVFGPKADVWGSVLNFYFTNCQDQLNIITFKMLSFLLKVENSPYRAVKEKYSCKSKFEGVSLLPAMAKSELERLLKVISQYGNVHST